MYSHKKHEDGRVKSGWEKWANEISNYPIKKKKKKVTNSFLNRRLGSMKFKFADRNR